FTREDLAWLAEIGACDSSPPTAAREPRAKINKDFRRDLLRPPAGTEQRGQRLQLGRPRLPRRTCSGSGRPRARAASASRGSPSDESGESEPPGGHDA